MEIWDTGGQERFKTIAKSYYDRAMAVLLIYDCTNERSFVDVQNWLRHIENHAQPSIVKVLVAAKADLTSEKVIDTERGKALANELSLTFFETSAKTDLNINKVFEHVAEQVIGKDIMYAELSNSFSVKPKKANEKKEGGCC